MSAGKADQLCQDRIHGNISFQNDADSVLMLSALLFPLAGRTEGAEHGLWKFKHQNDPEDQSDAELQGIEAGFRGEGPVVGDEMVDRPVDAAAGDQRKEARVHEDNAGAMMVHREDPGGQCDKGRGTEPRHGRGESAFLKECVK